MKISLVSQVSIDGKITFGQGSSSKELFTLLLDEDMKYIHEIRGNVDGILVGMNTIRYDNPSLTCRYGDGKNPIRIIPSNSFDIPRDATVLNDTIDTLLITPEINYKKTHILKNKKNVKLIFAGEKYINFDKAFSELENKFGIHTVMLEGGGTLNWELIDQDFVNEIIIMQIPIIIGGKDNISLVEGKGYQECKFAKKYSLKSVELRGNVAINKYVKNVEYA